MIEVTEKNIVSELIKLGYTESRLEQYNELIIASSTHYYGAVMLGNIPKWRDVISTMINTKFGKPLIND